MNRYASANAQAAAVSYVWNGVWNWRHSVCSLAHSLVGVKASFNRS